MDELTNRIIAFLSESDNPLGLLVLAGAACVEYVFPPFPGDTITLFGAVLVSAFAWSLGAVFAAVMAGSLAGSMAAFYAGDRLQARRERRGHDERDRIGRLVAKFRRYGAWYLVLNRFLPSFRAVFFVAAGMARMRPGAVLLYAAISAALWNGLIMAAGMVIGANLELMQRWLARYATAVWVAVAIALVAYAAVRFRRRRKPAEADDDG